LTLLGLYCYKIRHGAVAQLGEYLTGRDTKVPSHLLSILAFLYEFIEF